MEPVRRRRAAGSRSCRIGHRVGMEWVLSEVFRSIGHTCQKKQARPDEGLDLEHSVAAALDTRKLVDGSVRRKRHGCARASSFASPRLLHSWFFPDGNCAIDTGALRQSWTRSPPRKQASAVVSQLSSPARPR